MKPNDKDHPELWRDTLDEGVPADFAQESLQRMLGSARDRRQRKMAVKTGLAVAIVLPLLVLLLHRAPQTGTGAETSAPQIVEAGPVVEAVSPAPTPPAAVKGTVVLETIGDEELLAAFGNRPVALVGSGDAKQLVVLDKKK